MCKIFFIEGPDYSGKTTLISNLYNYFKSNSSRVAILREPDGEFRRMLLGKNGNLSFGTRRFLYAADHVQTLDSIYNIKDKFEYILVDRTTIVSDLIYSEFDCCNNKKLSCQMLDMLRKQFALIDKEQYNGYFKNNSHLILLSLSKQELINRMTSRAINQNDIFDIKSDDFKFQIWEKYKDLTEGVLSGDILLSSLFSKVSKIEVNDNLLNNTIKLMREE